jgi:hypothetical protein
MTWAKLARRLGTDHNPLRRRSDLIQAWLLPAAIAAFLVLGAPVAFGAIAVTHADNVATRQADRALHPVEAVLLTAAPGPLESARGTNSWLVWTSARWIAAGRPHVGLVPTGSGSRAGAVVRVWLDRAGQVRLPPLTAGQAGETDWLSVEPLWSRLE